MSYDLDLFTPKEGIQPITIIQQAAMTSKSADTIVNRALLDHLSRLNQNFNVQTSPVSISMVHRDTGIKISLYANSGQLSISYWQHDEDDFLHVFDLAMRCLSKIQAQAGYAIYDPQLGRLVNINADLKAMMGAYRKVNNRMESPF